LLQAPDRTQGTGPGHKKRAAAFFTFLGVEKREKRVLSLIFIFFLVSFFFSCTYWLVFSPY
jgi:hypothetical protein